jgi:DNA-directed RNA polymerase subunit beta'
MNNIVDFKSLTIKLASPDDIKTWSHGEILKPETINYRTLKPEKDGLFCERIFGPTKDWECYCGKYKRIRYKGIICDKCGVEVTLSRVRRERLGHIKLACPIAHIWFFRGTPSKLSLILDISPKDLSGVVYFAKYLVISIDEDKRKEVLNQADEALKKAKDELTGKEKAREEQVKMAGIKETKDIKTKIKSKEQQEMAVNEIQIKTKQELINNKDRFASERDATEEVYKTLKDLVKKVKIKSVLSEDQYLKLADYNLVDFLEVGMGAESLMKVVEKVDFDKLTDKLRKETHSDSAQRRIKAVKRLRLVESMRKAAIQPSWMILRVLPVIPPDLRPMVQLAGGRFATSDLNDLYRRVINRNNRLKHLINLGAPEIILRNEKRMLQEAVDTLIDASASRQKNRRGTKELRSLSDMLRGKQGRFRQNLLGKRVDYSGRSVIIVGPELSLHQCGLPKDMALEMFKPYVLRELIKRGLAPNVKSAKRVLERKPPEIFDILEEITKDHPVLLNRAPTLHKLGIQAFFPVLIEGNAIQIHPCVCAGYNADFDGDQMAVHVVLSNKSKEEVIERMLPAGNLLKPADGSPITIPNKEMAMGCYFLTTMDSKTNDSSGTIFSDEEEAILAFQTQKITLRQQIKTRLDGVITKTTVGRIIFNRTLPDYLPFMNEEINSQKIKQIIQQVLKNRSRDEVVKLIDDIKKVGFEAATISGASVSVFDAKIIPEKEKIIQEANKKAEEIESNFEMGLITNDEKRRLTNEVWMDTTEDIAEKTWKNLGEDNMIRLIINSGGTRASKDQVKQLAAMRGLVVDPLGKIVELPTKSNFREGLSVFEYVTSARGSRKGLTDSAIKTADAGYLTRRLVDASHDAIIRTVDCGTKNGLTIVKAGNRPKAFLNRITGRVTVKNIIDKNKKVIVKKGHLIDEEALPLIDKAGIESVVVRSPLTCQAHYGLCQQCYGWDFSTKKMVELGVPVGVLAAQSIGEPGTQLTMRVKHFGGIVVSDVTQGLPRVEELFEGRTPKVLAPLSDISGRVKVESTNQGYRIVVRTVGVKPAEEREYLIPVTLTLKVKDKEMIPAGHQLAAGSLNLKEILRIKGMKQVQEYLIEQIQQVYESQGIPINDKHFEVIVRKMCDKVQVETSGDTALLQGEMVEKRKFEEENASIMAEGGEPGTAKEIILGITRASLYTDSWLSAASFQETSNVLTNAATEGKTDYLLGLKENVIIGKLIPTSPERAYIED